MQVYSRLNHVCVSVSYNATLKLVEDISQLFTLPLQKWIADDVIFKFWGGIISVEFVTSALTTKGQWFTCIACL